MTRILRPDDPVFLDIDVSCDGDCDYTQWRFDGTYQNKYRLACQGCGDTTRVDPEHVALAENETVKQVATTDD